MGWTHFRGLFGHYPLIWPQANPLSPPAAKKSPIFDDQKIPPPVFSRPGAKSLRQAKKPRLADFAFARACKHSTSANANQSPFNIQLQFCICINSEMYFAKVWNIFLKKSALLILDLRVQKFSRCTCLSTFSFLHNCTILIIFMFLKLLKIIIIFIFLIIPKFLITTRRRVSNE